MNWRALSLLSLSITACSNDFTPYQEIDRLRVLAIGAEKPWLQPTETTTISALVVQDRDDESPLTYEWSWCPFITGNDRGFECAFTEAELQQQIDDAIGPGVVQVPSYALGTTSSTAFSYSLSPLFFSGLCEALSMQSLPDFVTVPKCEGTFPISIRLHVSDENEEVIAIRSLELVYDDAITEVNHNPIILGATAGTTTITDSLAVMRDTDVYLELDIPDSSIEPLAEGNEEVVVSWFADAGKLEDTRTARIDGVVDNLISNSWHTPRMADYPESIVRLWFVARDDRHGVSWIQRTVSLEEAQ